MNQPPNPTPTHDLSAIQALVRTKRYHARIEILDGLLELGFDEDDMVDCVLALTPGDFYKTMESEKRPGLWQDVYRPTYLGIELYLKLQIMGASASEVAVIISFKRK